MKNRILFLGVWSGLLLVCAITWLASVAPKLKSGRGYDSGYAPEEIGKVAAEAGDKLGAGWWRIRGGWSRVPDKARADKIKAGLRVLPAHGIRSVAYFNGQGWKSGMRTGTPRANLPVDLRDAYVMARKLGRTYAGMLDAWEIENEPELIYVAENPENYAAYLKAMSLGFRAGAEQALGWRPPSTVQRAPSTAHRRPLVLMAPMGLPPGPYFQALLDNGLLSYTDGFNFHSYGYAADFTGVYRMFEAAVAANSERLVHAGDPEPRLAAPVGSDLGRASPSAMRLPVRDLRQASESRTVDANPLSATNGRRSVVRKSLPIFLTEYGYGLMSGIAAKTAEGRVRQWRHFRDVYPQIQALQIEAPAAFYLRPYFEQDSREYGLTLATGDQLLATRNPSDQSLAGANQATNIFTAGGIKFLPSDFGAAKAESWMKDIGRPIGGNEASPALAWLMNQTGVPQSRPWVVHAERPSPVVIDFVAGADMWAAKWYRGHFLQAQAGEGYSGGGELRIYNFHHASVAGVLRVWGATRDAGLSRRLEIKAGDRAIVPLEFWASADRFRGQRWRAEFLPDDRRLARALFSSWNYPNYGAMRERRVENFSAAGEQTRVNAAFLDSRPQADDEERLSPQGRWRVSKGVRVEEDGDVWRFIVTGFPDEPLRPAAAELPLREGFRFTPDSLFAVDYRLRVRTIERVEPALEPRAERVFSALDREPIGIYVRSKTGNVFTMSGHWAATTQWQPYMQAAANFNLFPFGRSAMPWRFFEHEPAALVFHFRPRLLPAVYEVRNARVVELGSGD